MKEKSQGEYHSDTMNITVIQRISQWYNEYHSDTMNITVIQWISGTFSPG